MALLSPILDPLALAALARMCSVPDRWGWCPSADGMGITNVLWGPPPGQRTVQEGLDVTTLALDGYTVRS